MKKTVVFDFDGVIHSYVSGWCGEDQIPDEPVKGIGEVLKHVQEKYEVVIVSTRCRSESGKNAIQNWLKKYGLDIYVDRICKEKPPAIVYIDDRAICFDGNTDFLLQRIENFQPWNKRKLKSCAEVFFEVFPNVRKNSNGFPYGCPYDYGLINQEKCEAYECSVDLQCWNEPALEEYQKRMIIAL